MATSYAQLVHLWVLSSDWEGGPPLSEIPSKIHVGETVYDATDALIDTEDTFQFGPDHPARSAMDPDPESYWATGDRTEAATSGFFGNSYYLLPESQPHTPVTLRFYANNVLIGPTWPEEMVPEVDVIGLPTSDSETWSWHRVSLEPQGGGVFMGELVGYPFHPDTFFFDITVRAVSPPEIGLYVRFHLFHIEVEYTPPAAVGGLWGLRQRQTLPGTDSWPLRQRHNGSHTGSWPLRQRQTGI